MPTGAQSTGRLQAEIAFHPTYLVLRLEWGASASVCSLSLRGDDVAPLGPSERQDGGQQGRPSAHGASEACGPRSHRARLLGFLPED